MGKNKATFKIVVPAGGYAEIHLSKKYRKMSESKFVETAGNFDLDLKREYIFFTF